MTELALDHKAREGQFNVQPTTEVTMNEDSDLKREDGYTYEEAHAIIGCAHQLYIGMLVDRGELKVLGKMAKTKKDGTASKVQVVLLEKKGVEAYAKKFKARNDAEGRWYKAKLGPEQFKAAQEATPGVEWQDLTERKEEQELRKVERQMAKLNGGK